MTVKIILLKNFKYAQENIKKICVVPCNLIFKKRNVVSTIGLHLVLIHKFAVLLDG